MPMQVLRGFAVSAGIAIGPVVVLDRRGLPMPARNIARTAVSSELERLDRGLEEARAAASKDAAEARARLGPQYADILAAHCRMIADLTLRREARRIIEDEPDLRRARGAQSSSRDTRSAWNVWPVRIWQREQPTSATSRPGS